MNDRAMSEGEHQLAYEDPDPELMGEAAYEAACNELSEDPKPKTLAQPAGLWRTRDGRTLRIAEMETDHLRHAIRLFSLGGWADEPKIGELREELAGR
jgi:crotonobetainyl-CoA:carnitine CoA-transferase CaiB-like acyl-CoA transferase